jgi:hypothetical protein
MSAIETTPAPIAILPAREIATGRDCAIDPPTIKRRFEQQSSIFGDRARWHTL